MVPTQPVLLLLLTVCYDGAEHRSLWQACKLASSSCTGNLPSFQVQHMDPSIC